MGGFSEEWLEGEDGEEGHLKPYYILGHQCEWTIRHHEHVEYGCYPRIYHDGTIKACDAQNYFPINFCPGCGVKLPVSPVGEG